MPISKGNSKVGNIPNFSIRPVSDCTNCKTCSKTCYALKAWKQYPNVRKAWTTNSQNAHKGNLSEVREYLEKHNPEYFRIHVAGDFFSREYWNAWLDIVTDFPSVKFLAFTKSFDSVRGSAIPSNLSLVQSAFPGMHESQFRTDQPIAFAGDAGNYAPWMESRCKNAIECPGNCETCGACWSLAQKGLDVHFNLH